MAGEQPPERNGASNPWFNDRRFNFATSRQQLQQNLAQIGREMNNAVAENPAVLGQLRQQLEIISDLIRQGQGGRQEEAAAAAGAGGGAAMGGNAVVLDMTLGPPEQPSAVNDAVDETPTGSAASDDEQEDPAEPQQPPGTDDPPLPPTAAGNLNAEVRRIRELVRSPEIQRIIIVCLRILPFVVILLLKLLIDHALGLVAATLTVICFFVADLSVSKAVASRGSGQLALIRALMAMAIWLAANVFFFDDGSLILTLTFRLPTELTTDARFCTTLNAVFMVDFAVKFIGMLLKITVALLPHGCLVQKRRRRLYQWIEYTSQVYRYWTPVRPWFNYLKMTHSDDALSSALCVLLAVCYFTVKVARFRGVLQPWMSTTKYVFRLTAVGTRPSPSELGKENSSCAICYVDFTEPTKLACGHIFCEDCITTWLDKEHTCPMCRAEVIQEDNEWKSGSTSWMMQIF